MSDWFESASEVLGFARHLVATGRLDGEDRSHRQTAENVLYFFEKPWKWTPEYEAWKVRKAGAVRKREITVVHADHGVTSTLLTWALEVIKPTGFFCRTLEMPWVAGKLQNALYGPACGDDPVSSDEVFPMKRSEDRPASRMTLRPLRETDLLTVIGTVADNGDVTFFTAYGGPLAAREPGDPTLATDDDKKEAEVFWSKHALAHPIAVGSKVTHPQYEDLGVGEVVEIYPRNQLSSTPGARVNWSNGEASVLFVSKLRPVLLPGEGKE